MCHPESMTANISSPRIFAQKLLESLTALSSDAEDSNLFMEKYSLLKSSNLPQEIPISSSSSSCSSSLSLPYLSHDPISSLSHHIHHNLLQGIYNELSSILHFYDQTPSPPSSPSPSPPPPASSSGKGNITNQSNLLSISHLRGVYTALELLWCWGVLPYLTLTKELQKELIPKSILIPSPLILEVSERIKMTLNSITALPNVEIILLIFRTCTCHMFRGMMIERNFKRVLCACISILCHCTPQSLPNIDPRSLQQSRLTCQNLLNRVIMDPLVSPEKDPLLSIPEQNVDIDRCTTIESLRYVSMCGTSVMQHIVGSLLTMILIQPDGLRATLSVYLSGLWTMIDQF